MQAMEDYVKDAPQGVIVRKDQVCRASISILSCNICGFMCEMQAYNFKMFLL
jgi:hypothetical protein